MIQNIQALPGVESSSPVLHETPDPLDVPLFDKFQAISGKHSQIMLTDGSQIW